PDPARCREMIDHAIAVEQEGLWGQAYLDLTGEEEEVPETWITRAGDKLRSVGIPVTLERYSTPIPGGYPMRDPVFYFGWREPEANGPFLDKQFQFQKGAIAAHVTQDSASSLRDEDSWAGCLLSRGATVVMGNVSDPFLPLSHQLDLFVDRLIQGFTVAESAAIASQSLSWKGVVIGDPLYQPFPKKGEPLKEEKFGKDQMAPYKVLRLAYGRWGEGNVLPDRDLLFKLELASAKLPRAELIEHLGLTSMALGDFREAGTHFLRAKAKYEGARDRLRMDLHRVDLERVQGEVLRARRILQEAIQDYAEIPEGNAAEVFLDSLQVKK
ncbi:MAG: TIGR03790 family protein, partial [Verrucomicrobiota bacterium]